MWPHAPISRQPLAPGTYAFSPLGRCSLYLPWGPGTGRHWWALSVYLRVPVSVSSQMVAVYDVVEIAGISYGMISKRLAYDLNRNHTM